MWSNAFSDNPAAHNDRRNEHEYSSASSLQPPPAQGYPPPPPPPPPHEQEQGQQQQYPPPPPPPPPQQQQYQEQEDYHGDDSYYYPDGENGALTSTINLVTSAASALFRSPAAAASVAATQAQSPPPVYGSTTATTTTAASGTTGTTTNATVAPPNALPPPLEPQSSMLATSYGGTGAVSALDPNLATTSSAAPTANNGIASWNHSPQDGPDAIAETDAAVSLGGLAASQPLRAPSPTPPGLQTHQQFHPRGGATGGLVSAPAIVKANNDNNVPAMSTNANTSDGGGGGDDDTASANRTSVHNHNHGAAGRSPQPPIMHTVPPRQEPPQSPFATFTHPSPANIHESSSLQQEQQDERTNAATTGDATDAGALTRSAPPPTNHVPRSTTPVMPSSPSLQATKSATTAAAAAAAACTFSLPSPSSRSACSSSQQGAAFAGGLPPRSTTPVSASSPRSYGHFKLPPPLSLPRPHASPKTISGGSHAKKWGGFKVPPPIATTSSGTRSSRAKTPRAKTTVPSGITLSTAAGAASMPSPMASPRVDATGNDGTAAASAPAPSPSILAPSSLQPPLAQVTPNREEQAGTTEGSDNRGEAESKNQKTDALSSSSPPIMPQLGHNEGTSSNQVPFARTVSSSPHLIAVPPAAQSGDEAVANGVLPPAALPPPQQDPPPVVVQEHNAPAPEAPVFVSPQPPPPTAPAVEETNVNSFEAGAPAMVATAPERDERAPPPPPTFVGEPPVTQTMVADSMSPNTMTLPAMANAAAPPPPPPPPRSSGEKEARTTAAPPPPSFVTAPPVSGIEDSQESQRAEPFAAAAAAPSPVLNPAKETSSEVVPPPFVAPLPSAKSEELMTSSQQPPPPPLSTSVDAATSLPPSASPLAPAPSEEPTSAKPPPPFVAAPPQHASRMAEKTSQPPPPPLLVPAPIPADVAALPSLPQAVDENVQSADAGVGNAIAGIDYRVPPENEVPESDQQSENLDDFPEQTVVDEDITAEDVESLPPPPEEEHSQPALPHEWSEEIDPRSGQTYYYNSETGESSWERPVVEDAGDSSNAEMRQEEEVPHEDFVPEQHVEKDRGAEDTNSTPTPLQEETSHSPGSLPPGWSEDVDPSTGRSYYCNAETGTTTWERPPLEETVSCGTLLPDGWTERIDEASGEMYYYNAESNASTWERPVAALSTTEAADAIESTSDSASVQPGTGAEGGMKEDPLLGETEQSGPEEAIRTLSVAESDEASVLPAGWSEHIDAASGRPYYVNSAENVTSWERPTVSHDATLADVVEDGDSPNEIPEPPLIARSTEHNEADSLPESTSFAMDREYEVMQSNREEETEIVSERQPEDSEAITGDMHLPDNWEELVDPSSGRVYYYNATDGTSSWDRPIASRVGQTSSVSDSERERTTSEIEASNTDIRNPPESTAPKSAESWNFVSSQDSFDVVDDQPIVDDNPELHVEVSDEPDAGGGQRPVRNDSDEPATPHLPQYWTQLVDSDSGNLYYFNEQTRETSWERPTTSAVEPQQEADLDELNHTFADVDPSTTEEKPIEPSNVDQQTAKEFSEKEVAQLSANGQEAENDGENESAQPSTEPEATGASLPSGWVAIVDPSSGMTYYANEIEGRTTWERPCDVPKVADEDSALQESFVPSDDLSPSDSPKDETRPNDGPANETPSAAELEIEDDRHSDVNTQLSGAASVDVDESLPPGWVEMIEPSSGNPYYVNAQDNATTWEKPVRTTSPPNEHKTEKGRKGGSENIPTNITEQCDPLDDEREVRSITEKVTELALPAGWVDMIDPTSGKTYYFNETENLTTWERPEPAPSESTKEDKDDSTAAENDIAAGYTMVEHSESASKEGSERSAEDAQAPLPPGWLELVDEVSGDSYFLNEAENITTWERPSLSLSVGHEEVESLAQSRSEASSAVQPQETAQQPGPMSSPLQEGWSEAVDPTSGETYYFNENSGDTTWDRPIAPIMLNTASDGASKTAESPGHPLPARVLATFGFGGRLCVWKATAPSMVAIYRSGSISKDDPVLVAEQKKNEFHIAGPLNSCDDDAVLKHIDRRATRETTSRRRSYDLLWSLTLVAAKSNGRLRSDNGVQNPRSPEASVVDLLLSDDQESNDNSSGESSEATSQDDGVVGEVAALGSLKRVEELLLRGKREEAVQDALASKNFAMAFLVASMCDRTTFQSATKQFADEILAKERPLHTLAMLFSGQLQPPDDSAFDRTGTKPSIWDDSGQNLSSTWRQHLAATISNRTLGWDRIVLALGDHLLDSGNVPAAHFCYMVCGCSVTPLLHPSTRMCLVGCDHVVRMDAALLTPEGVAGFERTEAYEWAKRRGNPNAAIPSLQPFKLMYAMLLADLGLECQAQLYVESIRQCCGFDELKEGYTHASTIDTVWALSTGHKFEESLNKFEDRLGQGKHESRVALTSNSDNPGAGAIALAQPPPSSSPVDNPSASAKDMKTTKRVRVKKKSPRRVGSMDTVSEDDDFVPDDERKEEDVNATFLSAQSNLLDTSLAASAPPVKSDRHQTFLGVASEEQNLVQRQAVNNVPTRADGTVMASPSFPEKPKDESTFPSNVDSAQKAEMKKSIKPPPNSAPAILSASKRDSNIKGTAPEKAPSSEKKGNWGLGFKQRMTKLLNPNATTADLGLKMEAYYDDKLGWVWPNEDPVEKAKPIGPPPTGALPSASEPASLDKDETQKESAAAPQDALSAMMAPPKRASSFRRSSSTLSRMENAGVGSAAAVPRYPGPLMPARGGATPQPPSSGGRLPMTAALSTDGTSATAAPPQFTVFQPVAAPSPAAAEEEKQESLE